MKKMKKIIPLVASLAFTITAAALDPGPYTIGKFNGASGTNAAIAPATSVTNTIVVDEYNSAKLCLSVRANGASTANVQIRTYRSLNTSTYETTATTNLLALNGTTEVVGIVNLPKSYLANVGAIRVVLDNTNAASPSLTNINGVVRFTAPPLQFRNN